MTTPRTIDPQTFKPSDLLENETATYWDGKGFFYIGRLKGVLQYWKDSGLHRKWAQLSSGPHMVAADYDGYQSLNGILYLGTSDMDARYDGQGSVSDKEADQNYLEKKEALEAHLIRVYLRHPADEDEDDEEGEDGVEDLYEMGNGFWPYSPAYKAA